MAALDPEILELCHELESLGGGIKTRLEPIQTEVISVPKLMENEFEEVVNSINQMQTKDVPEIIEHDLVAKLTRSNLLNTSLVVFNQTKSRHRDSGTEQRSVDTVLTIEQCIVIQIAKELSASLHADMFEASSLEYVIEPLVIEAD
jgi:hypothetical protein